MCSIITKIDAASGEKSEAANHVAFGKEKAEKDLGALHHQLSGINGV